MFDSSISKEQVDFLLSREQQGWLCRVAYGATAAKAIVEWLYKVKPLHRGFLHVLCAENQLCYPRRGCHLPAHSHREVSL